MKDHRLPWPLTCPACGTSLDGALNTQSDRGPTDGDPSICVACRALLVYCGSPVNSLRYPSLDEQREFLADPMVRRAISAVGDVHRQSGPPR